MMPTANVNTAALCVRAPVEALPDDEVMESGWEELGISDERAAEIATAMVEDDAPSSGIDFYKVGGGEGTERVARPPRDQEGARHAMQCYAVERVRGDSCGLCMFCAGNVLAVAYAALGRARGYLVGQRRPKMPSELVYLLHAPAVGMGH